MPYAYKHHINVLKHVVYVSCWWRIQFEEAFWLHMWPRTPKFEPSSVGIPITVWGCYSMSMDIISICSNTFYMSNMDAGSKFDVAVGLNNDVMTSFWLHKWPRTPQYEKLVWV